MKCLSILLVVFTLTASAQVKLSPRAEISIITCGPYQGEVYAAFGHSAIRVADPENQINDAYNYGVFDFSQPNFYLNYTRGLLNFKLGVYSYPDFRDYYIYYNRAITEQVLDLTPQQKQSVYDFLEWNAQPENETYLYDYFYNNCATKVRDVFEHVLGDSIRFDGSFIATNYTIRQLTDLYLQQQPWGDLGIDICLGLPMDKKAVKREYMFLPDYIESSFDHAEVAHAGTMRPLVKYKQIAYVPRPQEVKRSWYHPWIVFGGLLLLTIALSVFDWKRKKLSKWFDILLFATTGLVGALLLLLWTATDHKAAANNFNLLWALPTHLLIVLIFRSKSHAFLKNYFLAAAIVTAVLLISWSFLPQQLNLFLIPFVATLLCREIVIFRLLGYSEKP